MLQCTLVVNCESNIMVCDILIAAPPTCTVPRGVHLVPPSIFIIIKLNSILVLVAATTTPTTTGLNETTLCARNCSRLSTSWPKLQRCFALHASLLFIYRTTFQFVATIKLSLQHAWLNTLNLPLSLVATKLARATPLCGSVRRHARIYLYARLICI